MALEFGLLGSIEAWSGDQPIDVGPVRQRCVLGVLLVDANRAVSVDQLIDRVWGDHPPQRAQVSLYSYLSRLRRALAGPSDGVGGIERRSGGYVLDVDPSAVDLHRFRRLVTRARAVDDRQAAALLEQALGLWRGEALAGLDTPWVGELRDTLRQERLTVELDHADIRLRHGGHAQVLAELLARAEAHPLDERLAGQLMLALYRSGRAADALTHYEAIRRQLAQELGADPTPALQALYQQILVGDPVLTLTEQVGTAPVQPASTQAVPRQLPAPPPGFIGRTCELTRLDRFLDADAQQGGSVAIAAISGAGGIGKTWLALRWGHTHLALFPDGQLFANLRGYDPTGQPVAPQVVIRAFLNALGVPAAAVPADPDAQAGLYRSLVADRRMLIMLDNARDSNQVIPLLPGSPACTVLVTSRDRLGGLTTTHGAQYLALDGLTEAEGRQVLARALGSERLAAEPQAAAALLQRCANLPLALGVVAARAATHPGFPLAVLAAELDEAATRLDALTTGDLAADLRGVFETSYRALDVQAARVFALMGLAPGPDSSLAAIAGLAALPIPRTRALLQLLENAHLVQQPTPGRYRMHDLIRLYAAELAAERTSAAERTTATERLYQWYSATLAAAVGMVDHLMASPADQVEELPPHVLSFQDRETAWSWLDDEYASLLALIQLAAAEQQHGRVVALALGMRRLFLLGRRTEDWIDVYKIAAERAHRTTDLPAEADLVGNLAIAHCLVGRTADSLPYYEQAMALYQRLGDDIGIAGVAGNLGNAHYLLGHYTDAARCFEQALAAFRRRADARGEANALNSLGRLATLLGRTEQAQRRLDQALEIFRDLRDLHGVAHALVNTGVVRGRAAQWDRAAACHREALTLFREFRDRAGEAEALSKLATAQAQAQDGVDRDAGMAALALHEDALTIARAVADPDLQAEICNDRGETALLLGDPRAAARSHQSALHPGSSDRRERARAHRGIGDAFHALGRTTDARREWTVAQQIFTDLRLPEADDLAGRTGS
ncbi:BTAD domain-containing putative transcriptional regulator [Kitasatospora sp. NPDC050543]|uniref:AfsR/SARP family transcriptional regulator n=1 Tax=Kitasatospora sp. NPDC050543 TaxID=3364054 RepID=UPI003794CF8E